MNYQENYSSWANTGRQRCGCQRSFGSCGCVTSTPRSGSCGCGTVTPRSGSCGCGTTTPRMNRCHAGNETAWRRRECCCNNDCTRQSAISRQGTCTRENNCTRENACARQSACGAKKSCGGIQNPNNCAGTSLAMVYAPSQDFQELYGSREGLCAGTIFSELNKPFYGSGGCCR